MTTRDAQAVVRHSDTLLEHGEALNDDGKSRAGGSWSAVGRWLACHNTPLTVGAALVAPVLYFIYLDHYAVNVLQGDDWYMAQLGVHQALHGHASLSQLWNQNLESRIILVKLFILLFASVDHFDTRSVIFFNALGYTAAYGILLMLFRRYLGRPLTPVPVLILGVVWFSLADVQSALWEFMMVDYLVVLFFVFMVFALVIPKTHRKIWFSLGLLAGVLASLSFVSGFVVWPLGVICIVWSRPWVRQTITEFCVWIGVACLTAAVYFWGFDWHDTGCSAVFDCTPNAALSHPLSGLRFFLVLIGDVIPGGYFGAPYPPSSYLRYELVGLVVCVVVVYIVVQSWRQRAGRERFPLPLLLVLLGVLMDAQVALGRTGGGLFSAINSNRYLFPNLILLSGIVVFACSHLPSRRQLVVEPRRTRIAALLCVLASVVFLGAQVVTATQFGLTNARLENRWLTDGARAAVNLKDIPPKDRQCERAAFLLPDPATIRVAGEDQLGEFAPGSYRFYRRLGPPALPMSC